MRFVVRPRGVSPRSARPLKVSTDTIARLERGEELRERTLDAIHAALETAGVEFTNGDAPGVKLRPGHAYQIWDGTVTEIKLGQRGGDGAA